MFLATSATVSTEETAFLAALCAIPAGYSEGWFEGRRWGVTLHSSADGRRRWLYGKELGATKHVSFNLYSLAGGMVLRPCEMPTEQVLAFVQGFVPDASLHQGRGGAPSLGTGSADGSGR
ncbi:hypothetical protein [Acidisphaera sp. L21]|uniref:hypothetical protein n=1 Tax=Acidisphaera sp. L21 TaxID=1641851 RepID=UPI001C2033F2|nr:hypothetical protein [Acidisphaera sp. L21]